MDAKKKRRLLLAAATLATGSLGVAGIFGGAELYDACFKRFNRPDYTQKLGICNFSQVKGVEREELFFLSKKVKLKGYYYPNKKAKALVVISHGMHAGADDYLPMALYMLKNGFAVFSFDYCGTYDSEGDGTVGMCQSLVDLDNALSFLKKTPPFSNMKICLLGHSWGGFASASVLALQKHVVASAVIAPFNNGHALVEQKGKQYIGITEPLSKTFLDVYQRFLFKKYVEYTGLRGVNETTAHVLIAHGVDDKVIDFNQQSIICHKDEITNPNVEYYVGTGLRAGHDSIWHSLESIDYYEKVKNDKKRMEKELKRKLEPQEIAEMYSKVNHEKISEVNRELFEQIVNMYNRALKA